MQLEDLQRIDSSRVLSEEKFQRDLRHDSADKVISRSQEELVSYLPSGKKITKKPFFQPDKDSDYSMFMARMAVFYTNVHADKEIRETFKKKKHTMENFKPVLSFAKQKSEELVTNKYAKTKPKNDKEKNENSIQALL